MPILYIQAPDMSHAWQDAVQALSTKPDYSALHMVVSIDNPSAEDPGIRAGLDLLLADLDQQSVNTIANTIFPTAIAATSSTHEELIARYLAYLPDLRRFKANQLGTYFARLIAYPSSSGPIDQIGAVISRLQKRGRATHTRYEALLDHPGLPHLEEPALDGTRFPGQVNDRHTGADGALVEQAQVDGVAPIYTPGKDNAPGTFPCMSHLSFQLDSSDRVHALAYYRSQSMVKKAYGNYLGLSRLLHYVADLADKRVGQLTIVAGKATIEMARRQVCLLAAQPDMLPGFAM